MAIENRSAIEAEIGQLLLDHWDPLGTRDLPEPRAGYPEYAHEAYNLLARGASNVQIGRRLHQAESGELHHPERPRATLRRCFPRCACSKNESERHPRERKSRP